MKYYNQNDLILVFGLIVISYFALRYLMTRKLLEGQGNNNSECESVEADLEEAQLAEEEASQALAAAQSAEEEARQALAAAQASYDAAQDSVRVSQNSVEECTRCEINATIRLAEAPGDLGNDDYIVTGDSCVKENNKNLRCDKSVQSSPEICNDMKHFFCKDGNWAEIPGETNSFICSRGVQGGGRSGHADPAAGDEGK